jgi:hypothetical protein
VTLALSPVGSYASLPATDQKELALGKKILAFTWKVDERVKKDPELSKMDDTINNIFFGNQPLTPRDKEVLLKTVQKYPDMLADVKDIIQMWDDYQKKLKSEQQKQ